MGVEEEEEAGKDEQAKGYEMVVPDINQSYTDIGLSLFLMPNKRRLNNLLQPLQIIQPLILLQQLEKPNRRYLSIPLILLTLKQVLTKLLRWMHHYLRSL